VITISKIENDKYYTEDTLSKYCVQKTFEVIGEDWDRIIEPAVGAGSFLTYLPEDTLYYDIEPDAALPATIKQDFREVNLPYISHSLVIGNPPFGRANKLSVQFVKQAMRLGDYASFIQPISQLNQNRTMKDTELLYSEDLGRAKYSGRTVHCCLNIYHKCKDGHKQDLSIPGILECRHIFRTGKYKHSDEILNYPWDFRISAWGRIRLLSEGHTCPNEIVFRVDNSIRDWLSKKLEECDYSKLLSCVSEPNLPAWRLRKWLKEEYTKEHYEEEI
jgi:hypothetical protein